MFILYMDMFYKKNRYCDNNRLKRDFQNDFGIQGVVLQLDRNLSDNFLRQRMTSRFLHATLYGGT